MSSILSFLTAINEIKVKKHCGKIFVRESIIFLDGKGK